VVRISKHTGLKPNEFAELRRLDLIVYNPNTVLKCYNILGDFDNYYVLTLKSHPCYFFDEEKRICKIYKYAPTSCRIYPYNEHGNVSNLAVCPLRARILFSLKKPKQYLMKKMKRETNAYYKFVKACNEMRLDKEKCFNKLIEFGEYYIKHHKLPF